MNVLQWLRQAQQELERTGGTSSRLDSLILSEQVLGIDRAQLLARPEFEVSEQQQKVLNDLLARRKRHEPLAYLLGKSAFYGREFVVSPAVLIPRPESETMIEVLKKILSDVPVRAVKRTPMSTSRSKPSPTLAKPVALRLADIGTGSGALGITAALELPEVTVDLLDIDEAALVIAKTNVIKHTTSINVIKADLVPENSTYDILLCNLPYVPDGFPINQAATFEPELALFAGADGLDLYRRLFQRLGIVRTKPLLILIESFPDQHDRLRRLATASGYTERLEDDFIQAFIPRDSQL